MRFEHDRQKRSQTHRARLALLLLLSAFTLFAACARPDQFLRPMEMSDEGKQRLFAETAKELVPSLPEAVRTTKHKAPEYQVYKFVQVKIAPNIASKTIYAWVKIESSSGAETVELEGKINSERQATLYDKKPIGPKQQRLTAQLYCRDEECKETIIDIYYKVNGKTLRQQFVTRKLQPKDDDDEVDPDDKFAVGANERDEYVGPARNEEALSQLANHEHKIEGTPGSTQASAEEWGASADDIADPGSAGSTPTQPGQQVEPSAQRPPTQPPNTTQTTTPARQPSQPAQPTRPAQQPPQATQPAPSTQQQSGAAQPARPSQQPAQPARPNQQTPQAAQPTQAPQQPTSVAPSAPAPVSAPAPAQPPESPAAAEQDPEAESNEETSHTPTRTGIGTAADQALLAAELKFGPLLNLRYGGRAEGDVNHGKLLNGTLLPLPGPGYRADNPRSPAHWGTGLLVDLIKTVGKMISKKYSDTELVIGNLSNQKGGHLINERGERSTHKSHYNGLDVDIAYVGNDGFDDVITSNETMRSNFDFERNWEVFKIVAGQKIVDNRTGKPTSVMMFTFVHPTVKKAFCGWARSKGIINNPVDAEILRRLWPAVEKYKDKNGVWREKRTHQDHFHLRLKCSPYYPDCQNQNEPPPGTGC